MAESRRRSERICCSGYCPGWQVKAGQSAEKGSVSIWFVRKALEALLRRGLDATTALNQAGISPALLPFDQSRVSPSSFAALWLAIAATLDDEFFGLDSRRMKVGSFATLCRLAVGSRSLREALRASVRFFGVLLDDTSLGVTLNESDRVQVTLHTRSGDGSSSVADPVFAHETLLIMLYGVLCWVIGRRIPIESASFNYPRPPWWREYLHMYSTNLAFDAAATGIVFNATYLDARVVQSQQTVHDFLQQAPYSIILKYKNPASLSARIRRHLRGLEPERWPTADVLAKDLRVAPSTLYRKLEAEGATYQQIKDALRRDDAIALLSHSGSSIADIAIQLGFAEASSFQRAFRQWTGVRPGEYRRSALIGAPHLRDDA